MKQTSVVLNDYAVSEDGTGITLSVGVVSSMGIFEIAHQEIPNL